ncbi:unnamed protein product [Toxocara canis]|uniref:Homeobox domain-containing protein n=1 Tax=Toxocara canis TaxID=6265 RepID=A0A183URD3_TOXCA|nr:unnamed protein product [Toxocara canis]
MHKPNPGASPSHYVRDFRSKEGIDKSESALFRWYRNFETCLGKTSWLISKVQHIEVVQSSSRLTCSWDSQLKCELLNCAVIFLLMATETDGRSASAPLAAPTTSAVPSAPHSTDGIDSGTLRGGVAFSAIPTAAPSFFANPFMTPFMPQQASSVAQANNVDTGEYRMNALPSDSYFLQSVQYQEMMQQYIQSLMAAASTLPSASTEFGNQCFDGTTEAISAQEQAATCNDDQASHMHVAALSEQMQQQLSARAETSTERFVPSASGTSSEETCCSHPETTTETDKTEESHNIIASSVFSEQPTSPVKHDQHDYPPDSTNNAPTASAHSENSQQPSHENSHSTSLQHTGQYLILIDNELCVPKSSSRWKSFLNLARGKRE